jgi:hypothetical protein
MFDRLLFRTLVIFYLAPLVCLAQSPADFKTTLGSPKLIDDFTRLFLAGNNLNPNAAATSSQPVSIPGDPRIMINLEDRVRTPTKVSIGLNTSILGMVQGEVKTEVEWSREYAVTTLIFVEGEKADIIRQDSHGERFFDPGTRKAVRMCALSGVLRLTNTYFGKVFAGAGGLEHSKNYDGVEEVRQTSEAVVVNPGESPESHKKACHDFADKKYSGVMKTLENLAASRIYWDELSQCNPHEEITESSVCGKWHRTLFPSVAAWTTPVCQRRPGQRNYFCNILSAKGGSCPYRDPETKKLLTSGMFEYPCAQGLECTLKELPGWFKAGKAECRPAISQTTLRSKNSRSGFSHN